MHLHTETGPQHWVIDIMKITFFRENYFLNLFSWVWVITFQCLVHLQICLRSLLKVFAVSNGLQISEKKRYYEQRLYIAF